ncbi:serine/threonine-protein kinase pim-1-like isoform X1 [Silurus meridionalis]|nr:serine/threonine-protein kinase pim-1-like isoform X1 [Silurus meridionalis]
MPENSLVLFRDCKSLQKKGFKLQGDQKKEDWCRYLAMLLCSVLPNADLRKVITGKRDNIAATKGQFYTVRLRHMLERKKFCVDLSILLDLCLERNTKITPSPKMLIAPDGYSSRAVEHEAFAFLTEKITSQYIIGGLLGEGGDGQVYAGICKANNRPVAVKYILRDDYGGNMKIPGEKRPIPREVGLMKMVSRPIRSQYVLELLEWFDTRKYHILILEQPSPCMNLEEFCELHGGKLPEHLARGIMLQVVQAARHCCDCGVFHNDIKPKNILINTHTLQVKLIDFGNGCLLSINHIKVWPGTPGYIPPEWYHDKRVLCRPVTVWTLGIVLFQLVSGDVPFLSKEEIMSGQLRLDPGLSKDCRKLITWCLEKNPYSRPDFRQILKHRWLMAGQSNIWSFPVLGHPVAHLIQFIDRCRKVDF